MPLSEFSCSLFQDVPGKRPVLINISLDGIKVCCPKGQVRAALAILFDACLCEPLKWPLTNIHTNFCRCPSKVQLLPLFRATKPPESQARAVTKILRKWLNLPLLLMARSLAQLWADTGQPKFKLG